MPAQSQTPSTTIPWLHAAVCVPVLEFLRHTGAPLDRELERHNLPLHPLDPARDIVLRDPFIACMASMARSQGIENVGYEAERWARRSLIKTPYVPSGAPTLYLALQDAIARIRRHCTLDMYLRETAEAVVFCRPTDPISWEHDTQAGAFAFQTILALVRRYAGPAWAPPRVGVPLPTATQRWFGALLPNTTCVLSGDVWWLEIPRRDMGLAPLDSRPDVGDATPDGEQEATRNPAIFADDGEVVSIIVRTHRPSGIPTLEMVAEMAGVSSRTLKRRLRAVNRSYADIVQEVRFQCGRRLLESTDLKIIDIAREADYATPSNFARAFRRFAGVSPRQYRARLTEQ